jgi:hypothetical protein
MAFDGAGEPYQQPPYWKIILAFVVIVVLIAIVWALLTGAIRIG